MFSWLKKKFKAEPSVSFDASPDPSAAANRVAENSSATAQSSDLHTSELIKLFTTARQSRDDRWKIKFFEHVVDAKFQFASAQQVQFGPDGFPYAKLRLATNDDAAQQISIRSIMDWAAGQGVGIVIETASGGDPEWVFSYGYVWSLRQFGKFEPEAPQDVMHGKHVVQKSTQVLIGQPSEEYLPKYVRELIKEFITHGLELKRTPGVLLMFEQELNIRSLVFSVFLEDFSSEQQFNMAMRRLHWFLPPHYLITGLPKDSAVAENLEPL